MNKDRLATIVTFLLALMLFPRVAAVQSQEQKRDRGVIKLSAELVQIDVLVTDKSNKPAVGLKREDFELYDNNKLQHLPTFAYEEIKPRQLEEDAGQPRTLPRAAPPISPPRSPAPDDR